PVELFNGKDLTGWKPRLSGMQNGWEVRDGLLTNATPGNDPGPGAGLRPQSHDPPQRPDRRAGADAGRARAGALRLRPVHPRPPGAVRMCTVTVVPTPGAVRLACNRDEQRTRPPALPPQVRRFGRRWAAFPVDPVGGGTWVAVNDTGLAMTVLNV